MGQATSAGQNSHLALIKALSNGSPQIDRSALEVGDLNVSDAVYFEGNMYSNKAPGLAFLTLPVYVALDAAGMRTTGDPTRVIWALGLLGSVLPAVVLVALVRRRAERLEPGLGTATAVTLGLGTLVLPYASIFLAHLLAACLLFGAFFLLWREREGSPSLRVAAAAGLLIGYAITSEYPSVLGGLALGVYMLSRPGTTRSLVGALRRAGAFVGGIGLGVLPLLAYNWWAFGSPTHLSYAGTGGASIREGDIGLPSFQVAADLLFGHWGLFQSAPVLALGVAGLVILFRRQRRAETAVIAAISISYFMLNAGLPWPHGGAAGTRYLIALLPFLALPLALAYRTLPLMTVALAAASVCPMVVMTATKPMGAWDGGVLARLTSADGSAETLADVVGITGWYDIVPWYGLIVFALACAVYATRLSVARAQVPGAVAALMGWAVVALLAPQVLNNDRLSKNASAFLAVVLASTVVLMIAFIHRRDLLLGPWAIRGRGKPVVRDT